MSTRREFIVSCSALAAVAAVAPLGALEGLFNFGLPVASIDQLSFAELAAQVNTRFRVYATPARMVELELVEASLDPGRPQHGRRAPPDADYEKFSLLFSGPRHELLDQKILKFEHDRLGRFELLVLPVFTRNPDRMNYQSVFNRPRRTCQPSYRATFAGTGLKA